jgi:hypothetical protein
MEYDRAVKVFNAEEVTQQAKEAQTEENDTEKLSVSLAAAVDKKWADAKEAKNNIELEMYNSVLQRRGEYTPEKLSQIRAVEQPEVFMNITEAKCRNGSYQIKDVLIQPGKRMFSVGPTPVPELPDEVMKKIQTGVLNMYIQMAVNQVQQTGQPIMSSQLRDMIISQTDEIKERVKQEVVKKAKLMAEEIENKIDDDFLQGGFYESIDKVVDDIVSLKAGIIKGPIFRNEKIKKTARDPESGKLSRAITSRIIATYERRSPFSIYPSPRSTGVDSGYLFDVIIIKPKDLHDLIGVEGYKESEIRAVLKEFGEGNLKSDWLDLTPEAKDGMGEEDQRKPSTFYPHENIYCLELWDEIPGQMLLDWGMTPEDITDKEDIYNVCIWKIGSHIIKAMLNYDILGRKPFHVTSFQKANDSFWGRGIPEMIEDCQTVCNACARAIVSNVGIASGPMIDMNVDRMEPGASRKIWPWRVFPTTSDMMGEKNKAIEFYQPVMVTDKLIKVYDTFSRIADEHSGVPSFAHGGDVKAAGNSSGLHQLREMAATGIKGVIRNIDFDIIVTCLEAHYDYLLDNQDIFGLLGDYKMVAEGSSALIAKEQMVVRKNEFLTATGNPLDIQLIGVKNRRKLLFEVAKGLGFDIDEDEFPPVNMNMGQEPPQPGAATLDESGNPTQGVDNRQENPERPRLPVSTGGSPDANVMGAM